MSRLTSLSPLALFALLSACSAGHAVGDSQNQAVETSSAKFRDRTSIVSPTEIPHGGTVQGLKYTSSPEFRSILFFANAGDELTIRVTSSTGADPVAFLQEDSVNFKTIPGSDAVKGVIHLKMPKTSSFQPVLSFKEAKGRAATFSVSLEVKEAPLAVPPWTDERGEVKKSVFGVDVRVFDVNPDLDAVASTFSNTAAGPVWFTHAATASPSDLTALLKDDGRLHDFVANLEIVKQVPPTHITNPARHTVLTGADLLAAVAEVIAGEAEANLRQGGAGSKDPFEQANEQEVARTGHTVAQALVQGNTADLVALRWEYDNGDSGEVGVVVLDLKTGAIRMFIQVNDT